MTRTRRSARDAGTRFETSIATCLATHIHPDIERRRPNGALDRGDITGLRAMGGRVVVEVKDYGGRFLVGPWLAEVEVERGNDDALAGVVVAKRRGVTDPLEQVAFLTVRDLVALVTGERP